MCSSRRPIVTHASIEFHHAHNGLNHSRECVVCETRAGYPPTAASVAFRLPTTAKHISGVIA